MNLAWKSFVKINRVDRVSDRINSTRLQNDSGKIVDYLRNSQDIHAYSNVF